jgi:O-antigen ligase
MISARQLQLIQKPFESPVTPASNPFVRKFKLPVLLAIAHIPLGILLYRSSALAFLYPAAVFLLGLYHAFRQDKKMEKVALFCAYLTGAEVLWRMAGSSIFWEFGKYSVAGIMIIALVRRRCWKFPTFPMLYFALLIPACFFTVLNNSPADAKDKISFNLSGPFLLFICCWFFSHLKFNWIQVKRLLVIITVPLISVGVSTLFYTVTAVDIQFGTESNFATSGGFGPNQVSSMLGLGVFLCLSAYLLFKNTFKDTIYFVILALFFAAQSVLTFSRGGMYNAVSALSCVILFQLGNLKQGAKRLFLLLGFGVIFLLIVFPYLNDFTGGALQLRFEDTDSTGRVEIVDADLHIFSENPFMGVGVGEAKLLREIYFGKPVGAHTEFSRILSEHGMLGIIALFFLGIGFIQSLALQKVKLARALAIGALVWSCFFMMNAGMRLAAPSFLCGFSYLMILTPSPRKKLARQNTRNFTPKYTT